MSAYPSRRCSANPPRPFRFNVQLPALIAETQHLDPEAFGCLMRLMHSYWQSGPAKDDDRVLARIVGLPPDEWAGIRPDVEPFFDVLHGQWINWRLDEELESAYEAINRNRTRTQAATAARKAKRNEQRDDERNDKRDDERNDKRDVQEICNQRDVVRNEHPIESIRTPRSAASGTDKARAKAEMSDFEDDVRAAERDLGIGGEA